ncbi:DUF4169 family protein [Litorivita sp. NS0012-18]|uniref:DUF4169 family protein n=1 Tax=Litorivita sp. NS0012-18 TaxID=3127655 RepID=UPI003107DF20
MSNVTNLNQFRKAKAKREAREEADRNAVKFGRPKADKELERARAEKSKRDLDGHKSGDGDDDTAP